MTRAFTSEAIEPTRVEALIDLARRGPSAGNTAALDWLVLESPRDVGAYWDTTLPVDRRATFPWPELLDAPVIVVPWVDPSAYVARYGESDKVHTGLGRSIADWPVPYWFVDGGAAIQTLLLAAEDQGLGALMFGLFEHEEAVRQRFEVPEGRRAVAAVAIGHKAPDRPSRSARRPQPTLEGLLHRGGW